MCNNMCGGNQCGGNGGNCLWVIILLIVLWSCCGNNSFGGCGNCGCNDNCNSGCGC